MSSLQELSKIAMPVILNEPLSFLQRITEYMEHTYLIHRANATADSVERMKVTFTLLSQRWDRSLKWCCAKMTVDTYLCYK